MLSVYYVLTILTVVITKTCSDLLRLASGKSLQLVWFDERVSGSRKEISQGSNKTFREAKDTPCDGKIDVVEGVPLPT